MIYVNWVLPSSLNAFAHPLMLYNIKEIFPTLINVQSVFMIKNKLILASLLLFSALQIRAQSSSSEVYQKIDGYWQGAFIKNNSYQKLEVQFYMEQDAMKSLQIIDEWHPQFGEFVLPVTVDTLNQISFNTGYGKALMKLDKNALEMVGQIQGSLPTIYVHLKKIPDPPAPDFQAEEVQILNGSNTLYGHLHQPAIRSKTAIIIVGGRGCYAGNTKYDLYAKLLRNYGVSVLSFHKRGTGRSSGNCSTATIEDLASDIAACREFLASHENQYAAIGVLGSSAGAWVMNKAGEQADFDFMISIAGPATSVYEQQMKSMENGFEFYGLYKESKSEAMEYTRMMFEARANQKSLDNFRELLGKSEQNGWKELLEDTDIPTTIQDIENLWVRRHKYDPKRALSSFEKPYLAIFGQIDWIVPYQENIEKLNEYFSPNNRPKLTTVVAHDAEHGTETKGKYISLEGDQSYWRFFRVSPIVQISIIQFLKKHNFID